MLEQSKIRKNYAIVLLCLSLTLFTLALTLVTLDTLYQSYLERKIKQQKEINVNMKITKEIE